MEKAPTTYKAKVAWLQEKLDAIETERLKWKEEAEHFKMAAEMYIAKRKDEAERYEEQIKQLRQDLDAERLERRETSLELDAAKRRLAESQAWAEIEMYEHDVTRKELHRIYTDGILERGE